jgi:hypothetical protein
MALLINSDCDNRDLRETERPNGDRSGVRTVTLPMR